MRGGCLGRRIRGVFVRGLSWGAVAVFLACFACLGLGFALVCLGLLAFISLILPFVSYALKISRSDPLNLVKRVTLTPRTVRAQHTIRIKLGSAFAEPSGTMVVTGRSHEVPGQETTCQLKPRQLSKVEVEQDATEWLLTVRHGVAAIR